MRRMIAAVVAVLAVAGALLAAGGQARADDSYSPTVPTRCNIVASAVQVGDRVILTASVDANSTTPKVGSLKLSISTTATNARAIRARAAREVIWTRTLRYNGAPVEVAGPVLPRGVYFVDMTFTPDGGSEIVGCVANTRFRVGGDFGGETDDNGGDGLPNTGGPNLMWLLLGSALVVAGAGAVGGSRRMSRTPRHVGTHAARA